MAGPTRTDFWGAELSSKKKEVAWDGSEEDDPDINHTLHIQRVVLGAGVKGDEANLVTVTAEDINGEEITHPLCWLSKKSIADSQCSLHLSLSPPVTLKLAQGSGPVHVIGIHEMQLDDDDVDELSDLNEEEDEEVDQGKMDTKLVGKQLKRPAESPPTVTKQPKMAKREADSDAHPLSKGKKAAIAFKPAEDDDDDEDDDDEDYDDDMAAGLDMEDDDDDDEEDEEEDVEEDDDEDEEEEESEEEAEIVPQKKKSAQKLVSKVPKQGAKSDSLKQKSKPGTPKTIQEAGKKQKPATPAASLDDLKARLAKSPNIPKKREKFNNYLQNNLKVTNPEMKNKLWAYVQGLNK